MRARHFALAIGATIVAAHCWAAPDATARYLMNEPASMLDVGILEMNVLLALNPQVSGANPSVEYDWDKNRIRVNLLQNMMPSGKGADADLPAAERRCKHLINTARYALGVLPSGETFFKENSVAATMFEHADYMGKAQPKHLLRNVDKLIEVDAIVPYGGERPVECVAPLIGRDIFFKSQ